MSTKFTLAFLSPECCPVNLVSVGNKSVESRTCMTSSSTPSTQRVLKQGSRWLLSLVFVVHLLNFYIPRFLSIFSTIEVQQSNSLALPTSLSSNPYLTPCHPLTLSLHEDKMKHLLNFVKNYTML